MKQSLEEKIVRSAARLFARKGFHTCTMRDIATAARVSTGAIYHYFPSKEDIYLAIVHREYRRRKEMIESKRLENPSTEDLVRSAVSLLFEMAEEYGRAEQLVLHLRVPETPRLRKEVQQLREELLQYVADLIESGVRKGTIRACDPTVAATALIGMGEAVTGRALAGPASEHLMKNGPEQLATMAWHALRPDAFGGADAARLDAETTAATRHDAGRGDS